MKELLILFFVLFAFQTMESQRIEKDSINTRKEKLMSDPLTPSKAAFYSAVVPGLGQVYSRRAWMVPIIYGGLGASAYYYDYNKKEADKYRTAYKRRLSGYFDDEYMDIIPEDDTEKLLEGMRFHRRYKDISFIFLVGTYVLNIIDANVGAHLLQFNVSEDLSFEPYINSNYLDINESIGLSLKINLD